MRSPLQHHLLGTLYQTRFLKLTILTFLFATIIQYSALYCGTVLWSLHWLPVRQRIVYKLATLVHKCLTGRAPAYLAEYCRQAGTRRSGMRSAGTSMLDVPRTRTALCDRSFAVAGPRIWNSLPAGIRDPTLSPGTFATLLKTYLFV